MTWPFVRRMIDRDEVGSTSDLARELLETAGHDCPFAVRARRQTRGRGQRDNSWWSDEGCLTVTIALDPASHDLRPEHHPRTALAVAVAVVDAVAPFVVERGRLGIRWPNDVEAGGLKLAGILPERLETSAGPRLLIGLGVNVSTRLENAPPDVRQMATSIRSLCPSDGEGPNQDDVLRGVLQGLPGVLGSLSRDDPMLAARWAALDALRGSTAKVDVGTRLVTGVASGIDPAGALLLNSGGETLRLFGGRVLRGK